MHSSSNQLVSVPTLIQGAAAWFLASCRHGKGRRVALEVLASGELRLEGDALALDIAPRGQAAPDVVLGMSETALPDERVAWPSLLAGCSAWRVEWVEDASPGVRVSTGRHEVRLTDGQRSTVETERWVTRFTFTIDCDRVQGDVQSPDVLYALRDQAARWPEAQFLVRLPPGTRDIQRARAGLTSSWVDSPASEPRE